MAIERYYKLRWPVQLFAELARTGIGLADFWRGIMLSGRQRLAERYLEVKLTLVTPSIVRQVGQQVQPLPKLANRFFHCRASNSLLPRFQEITHRLVG